MKALVLLLIAANLVLLGIELGPLRAPLPATRVAEIAPQDMRLLQNGPARLAACIELGGFAADERARIEKLLGEFTLDQAATPREVNDQDRWMVYLPPARNRADAERARAALRSRGVNDLYLILDDSAQRLGISLGLFSNQEAANQARAALERRGIDGLRVVQRDNQTGRTWYQWRNATADMLAALAQVRRQFPEQELRDCP